MQQATYTYASGAESLECPHHATTRTDDYRIDCVACGASAYAPTEAAAAEVADALRTIADWQNDGFEPWEFEEADADDDRAVHYEVECQDDATHGVHEATFAYEKEDGVRVFSVVCGEYTERYTDEVVRAVGTVPTAADLGLDLEPCEERDFAVEVADAEDLLGSGEVDAGETASAAVSGVLHGQVLLILAEREEARPSGLSLTDAAERARVLAVVVERVRVGAAVLAGSLFAA